MARTTGAFAATQRWLDAHSGSAHTRRKYDAQLQQLCEWLFLHDRTLANVQTADLQVYLTDLARGELSSVEGQKTLRSRATIIQTRSVVSSLFEFLVREGFRRTNPVSGTATPMAHEVLEPVRHSTLRPPAVRWLDIRADVIGRARRDEIPRSPLRRALAVAELASWAGLRRSELAVATMDQFVQMHRQWWICVARFGRGDTDLVEVPKPAMEAVSLYRLCRDLPDLPSASERGVPLIARLRSETPVNAWSVANALQDLLPDAQGEVNTSGAPTIIALRREVASEALKAKIAAHQLARHMRSRTLVDQVGVELSRDAVAPALERLAA